MSSQTAQHSRAAPVVVPREQARLESEVDARTEDDNPVEVGSTDSDEPDGVPPALQEVGGIGALPAAREFEGDGIDDVPLAFVSFAGHAPPNL